MARKEVVPIPYTARLHPEKGEYMAVRYWSPEGKRKTKSLGYRGTEEYRKNYAEFMALYEQMFESGLDPASVKNSKEEISPKEYTLGEILIYAWDNVVPDLYQTASGEVKREWYTAKHVVTDFTRLYSDLVSGPNRDCLDRHKSFCEIITMNCLGPRKMARFNASFEYAPT